uniref:Uncharacterized protein n=1 Tax=Anguilla anguilla TaxID=7936 RepID=A0A0E9SH03_ANGAN
MTSHMGHHTCSLSLRRCRLAMGELC